MSHLKADEPDTDVRGPPPCRSLSVLDVTATNEPTGGTAPHLHEDQKPPSRDTGGRHLSAAASGAARQRQSAIGFTS